MHVIEVLSRGQKPAPRAFQVFFAGHSTKAQHARADADTDPESLDSQEGETNPLPLSVAEPGKVT